MRFSNRLLTDVICSVPSTATRTLIVAVALYNSGLVVDDTSVAPAAEREQSDQSPFYPIREGEKAGYIDRTGKIVIQPRFRWTTRFSEQLAAVSNAAYKWGYIDRRGEVVIPLQFNDAEPFSEGRAAVKIGDKWTYIDKSGASITARRFTRVEPFREGLALLRGRSNRLSRDVDWRQMGVH